MWGVFGLSFVVVLVNALAAAGSVTARGPRAKAWCGLFAGLVAGAMWMQGDTRDESRRRVQCAHAARGTGSNPTSTWPSNGNPSSRTQSFNMIERQARQARDQGADLVIFPETAAPALHRERSRLQDAADRAGAGAADSHLRRFSSTTASTAPTTRSISTTRPACFGATDRSTSTTNATCCPVRRSTPLGSRYRWIRKINFGQANFQPGPDRGPLSEDSVSFTPLICFESVFPDLCREGVHAGSELFRQHHQRRLVRRYAGAVPARADGDRARWEFRRWLVRSANSGVSMVVTPAGEVVSSLDLYKEGVLTADVQLLSGDVLRAPR